jgi:hypothetical protein
MYTEFDHKATIFEKIHKQKRPVLLDVNIFKKIILLDALPIIVPKLAPKPFLLRGAFRPQREF